MTIIFLFGYRKTFYRKHERYEEMNVPEIFSRTYTLKFTNIGRVTSYECHANVSHLTFCVI